MKKISIILLAGLFLGASLSSCKKDPNNAIGTLNPFAAIFVVKNAYKGTDVQLNTDNLAGASTTGGIVISDAQKGNMTKGTLVIQNTDRGITRGLIIELGDVAVPFVPGDSVVVKLEGGTLAKKEGSIRLKGLSIGAVTKISSGKTQKIQTVPANLILASPATYEGTLLTITNATFTPKPAPGAVYSGNKLVNDGFGDLTIHTESTASYANQALSESVNVTGIMFATATANGTGAQIWPRSDADIFAIRSQDSSPVLITGYLIDPNGSDANYEYIQLMATEDIDFSVRNFAVVTTNNAGGSTPVGLPTKGWATGGLRTYKFNLTAGKVTKGSIFYVGGNKNINGAGSTDISSANWINSTLYANVPGAGFGDITTNLLANSGNLAGIAVFASATVDETTVPVDVIFFGGSGSFYSAGPPEVGYRITNTDYYDLKNPASQADQVFFGAGSNTGKFAFTTAISFAKLGGVYNVSKGRWAVGRTLTSVAVPATATLSVIEGGTSLEP